MAEITNSNTSKLGTYQKYIKPKYDSDPEYREKLLERTRKYRQSLSPDELRARNREYARRHYETHPEVKEQKRLYAQAKRMNQIISCRSCLATTKVA